MITEHRIFWLIILAVLGGLAYVLGDVLTPFVVCLVLAYMLDPLVDNLEHWGIGRTVAAIVICFGSILMFLMFFVFLIPLVISQTMALAKAMPEILTWLQSHADAFFNAPSPALDWVISLLSIEDTADVQQQLMREAQQTFRKMGGVLFQDTSTILRAIARHIGAIGNSLSILLLVPFILFYLLRDWDRMITQIVDVLPRSTVDSARVLGLRCNRVLGGFFRGQLLVAVFLGLFYGTGLVLVALPFGFVIGLFTGLFVFVPYVGVVLGFLVAEIVALVHFGSWMQPAIIAAIFFAGQVIESSVLTPKLIGDNIQLHPVWIIFGLLTGGSLFGFTGLLLAIPVLAILGVVVCFIVERYQSSHLYEDR
ncbi:MAG: AI-2E family transporter [Alphaproteobacteria bacterium]|nr:AI-2E family transporter [Alphaproteobacteria bacterium]